jgi:prepilin-type N-terminal cleavage/methylation domain-containing protein
MKRQHKNNHGFSLVELIVSIAILAVVVLPLLKSFVVSAGTNSKAKQKLQATEASQNILETFEAKSLDELFDYFTGTDSGLFYEDAHTMLVKDGSAFRTTSTADADASTWYFAIKGINDLDALVTVSANESSTAAADGGSSDGTALNEQEIVNLSSIDSRHDALCSLSKTPDEVMAEIQAKYPDVEQRDVTRNIEITISTINDPDSETVYTKVTAQYRFTWTKNGVSETFPSSLNEGEYTDVIFDNSPYTDRELNNVYLFFYPWYTSTLAGGNPTDIITIHNLAQQEVNVYLIKQTVNVTDLKTLESNYQVLVNINESVSGAGSAAKTKLRTNLLTNLADGTEVSSQQRLALNGVLLNDSDKDRILQDSLTAEAKKDRLYDVTVEIYPSGSYKRGSYFKNKEALMTFTGGMVN